MTFEELPIDAYLHQTDSSVSSTPLEEHHLSATSPFITLEELLYISSIPQSDPYGQEISSQLKERLPLTTSLMTFKEQPTATHLCLIMTFKKLPIDDLFRLLAPFR